MAKLQKLRRMLKKLRPKLRRKLRRKKEKEFIKNQMERKKARSADWDMQQELLRDADVICTTTIASGGDIVSHLNFGCILMDEAAQATELSAIVPILLRGSARLVLVGDHCQLPPTIQSLEAETRGLSVSLYSRFVGQGVEPFFLNTQYRSHPKIAEFSANAFYGGLLQSGVDPEKRPAPKGFIWPSDKAPVCFLEVPERESRSGDSKENHAEAKKVQETVSALLSAGELTCHDIGVVTPYMGQVRALRKSLREQLQPMLRRLQRSARDDWQKYDAKFLEIGSVDGFQGREKEIIVFSAVRSNNYGRVGFLADWRRLNVMLTRARRGLIVIGHAATLMHDPFWQQWLEFCGKNDCIVGWGKGALTPVPTQSEFTNRLGPSTVQKGQAQGTGKGNSWSSGKGGGDSWNSGNPGKSQAKGQSWQGSQPQPWAAQKRGPDSDGFMRPNAKAKPGGGGSWSSW